MFWQKFCDGMRRKFGYQGVFCSTQILYRNWLYPIPNLKTGKFCGMGSRKISQLYTPDLWKIKYFAQSDHKHRVQNKTMNLKTFRTFLELLKRWNFPDVKMNMACLFKDEIRLIVVLHDLPRQRWDSSCFPQIQNGTEESNYDLGSNLPKTDGCSNKARLFQNT